MNLAQLLVATADRVPFAAAIVSGDRVLMSYRELATSVAGRAATLTHSHGITSGSRVGVYASNSPEYLELLFAIWWTGATAVPVSAMAHAREVHDLLDDCRASLLIASEDKVEAVAAASRGRSLITVDDLVVDAERASGRPADVLPDDPAWIFYTSGTTGRPKGALLSNANLLAMSAAHLAEVEFLDERSGLLHLALMSHAGGLFALPFVARGARQVIPESRSADPAETWALLRSQDRLSLFAPPVLLRRLVAAPEAASADTSRMGTVLVGAAPVLVDDLVSGVNVFGPRIWNGYGQGETPLTITALGTRELGAAVEASDHSTLQSVGFPRIATEVRVVDAEDRDLPEGEAGEIIVRGPTVMSGYLDRAEANAETLRGGWLHTGDIGRFDDGRLTLLDRSKDLVITGGANVYPREVEDALMLHTSVVDVAVIGVPDEEWGERVVAFIVPASAAEFDAQALEQHCLDSIARYKRPKEYRVVSSLPRNGAGKVVKSELRATLARVDKE